MLAGLCAMYMITYIDRVNISTTAPVLQKDLALSETELGLVFSAFAGTGLANGLVTLFVARALLGLGEGATFPTATKAMAIWLPAHKRARCYGPCRWTWRPNLLERQGE